MISWLAIAVLAATPVAPSDDSGPATTPAGEFAPDPGPLVGPSFRGDFRAAWGLTDGSGVLDHAVLEFDVGVQVIPARIGVPAPAPLFGIAGTVAESGEASLRITGGIELPIRIAPMLEVVPAFFGGFMKLFAGDRREGPMFRGALGLRVLGDDGFFITVEPLSVTVLPIPPAGPARYTDHVSFEVAIIKIGGRAP